MLGRRLHGAPPAHARTHDICLLRVGKLELQPAVSRHFCHFQAHPVAIVQALSARRVRMHEKEWIWRDLERPRLIAETRMVVALLAVASDNDQWVARADVGSFPLALRR